MSFFSIFFLSRWLIFQPCLWGYFLGSLIVSFKNPLRVKTHFFAFFNFLIFFSSTLLLLSYAILIAPLPSFRLLRPLEGAANSEWRRGDDNGWMESIRWPDKNHEVQKVWRRSFRSQWSQFQVIQHLKLIIKK